MLHEGNHSSKQTFSSEVSKEIVPQNFDQEMESVLAAEEHDEELLVRSEHDRAAQAAREIVKG